MKPGRQITDTSFKKDDVLSPWYLRAKALNGLAFRS